MTITLLAVSIHTINAQDTLSISADNYELKEMNTMPARTQGLTKAGRSVLKQGLYQSVTSYTHTIFSVNDSGYLHGDMKKFSGPKLQKVSRWDNGRFVRECMYNYDNGRLMQESYDSLVAVFLYDSTTNNWNSKTQTVRVRKEYSMVKGAENDWLMIFNGGPENAHAMFHFSKGKMVSSNYLNFILQMYNDKGEVRFREVHNWKLKQIETTSFTDTATWKNIAKNKNISWNKNGTISYLTIGNAGEDKQRVLYKSGKLVTREVFKNNTRTVTEYDGNGKIKTKEVYKLPKVKNEIVAPV